MQDNEKFKQMTKEIFADDNMMFDVKRLKGK